MHKGIQVNINRVVGRAWLSIAALLLSAAFSTAFADTGGLQVKVTDATGNPIAGAAVSASTIDSLSKKSGVTNADGELRLMGLDPSDNYVISVTADGYQAARNEGVLVVSERTYDIPFSLVGGGEELEEIITYGRSDIGQLVDTTSALQSTDVTLDIMDSLPTGRNYQSYLQMAPSTKPTNDENGGNPSSKSGVNYSDVVDANGNTAGSSSDNVYYIDGVNITDNYYGTFGANFNSEIIQEQQIITGGVPAEYEGGQGLISRVVTKSGGNEFHGSLNYYMQSDSLVADNDNLEDASFSTFDTAFTLGGPIIKDKLWFFTSYQLKEREEDVIDPNTQQVLRTVTNSADYGFAKLTWQATENDKITAQWFNDPSDVDGSFDTATLANRDRALERGGDNLKFEYSHAWENLILTASYISHEGEDTRIAADKSTRNDTVFLASEGALNSDTDLGGYGSDLFWDKNKKSTNLVAEYFLDTNMGSHEFKFGYSDMTNEHFLNSVYTGDGSQYNSIADIHSGTTLDEYTNLTWTGEVALSSDDYNRVIDGMAASDDAAYFVGLLDTSGDGIIDQTELGALVFESTAGNPNGQVNAVRARQATQGPQNFKTEGTAIFLQDSWNIDDHWTVDVGFRAEKWDHIASDAKTKVFSFDYEVAPRLSLIYDIKGDGASKVWAFYGRYYDPIRTNMTDFAGSVTGSVLSEEIYVGNQWVNYRTRGGPGDPDGYFAPSTKTPYTDEFMLGWEHSLTADQSIAVTYTDRETGDILEDYDLGLYLDCTADGVGDYCLPLSYFGFSELPSANYFISTMKGGKRVYEGLEVTWRKRRSADSKWFALASWSYNDAEGNTNSDSNADFQGDVVWLDPRSPNQYGKQPGNVEHLVKLAGSYAFDNGLEIGATYNWNSGTRYSETWSIYGRHLPERVAVAYEDRGVTTRWLDEGVIGGNETSSYGTLNARAKYVLEFGEGLSAEIFLDVFNVLDDQAARRFMDLRAGDGVYSFGEANDWVLPRRFYLGARMSF
jgi:hypothetical protein